jgi:Leucine-rich repeat (LRR) protein
LVKLPECIEEMKSLTILYVVGGDVECVPRGMSKMDKMSD